MGHKAEDQTQRKCVFMMHWQVSWTLEILVSSEIIVSLGNFNGYVGKCAEGFEDIHGSNGIEKSNAEGRRFLEFCDERAVLGKHLVL